MNEIPKGWIKRVESLAMGTRDASMWGAFPAFPWKGFAEVLGEILGGAKLNISPGKAEWKSGNTILSGMGRSPLQLAIELSPLKGSFSLVFPSEDFSKLSSWAIHPDAGNEGFSDPYLQKGFFRYLTAQAMTILERIQAFQGLAPKLVDMPLAKEDGYSIDIAIEHNGETVWGRLIAPAEFQQSLKAHFASDWHFSLASPLYPSLHVDLSLSAGTTTLSQETWEKVQQGDFIILDHCSYYPKIKKGTFQLQLDGAPLFQAKLKEETIKLLDYAHTFEENHMDEENFEEPFYEEPTPEGEQQGVSVEEAPQGPMLSPKKVPISLSIEVTRLKMNLDKLLKLKPGNVLELGVHPEQGVRLMAGGSCVGKGQLLQIGDVIGVKITELGE